MKVASYNSKLHCDFCILIIHEWNCGTAKAKRKTFNSTILVFTINLAIGYSVVILWLSISYSHRLAERERGTYYIGDPKTVCFQT